MLHISDKEIADFSKYILEISSIFLDKSKGYLLETRLKSMMDKTGSTSYSELLDKIRTDPTKKLKKNLIDAISTNETFFFRDDVPFNLLQNKIIPDLIDLRRRQHPTRPILIKIWSAACSTGQEVYSIAITLLEMLSGMGSFEISILGTDISGEAVAQASYGKYNSFEIERGLPQDKRQKYFSRVGDGWRIKDEIRSLAKFEKMNLMRPFPPSLGQFDVIFCRNVAIYFQSHDKINLFKKIARVTATGGSLIVGGSENLLSIAPDFKSQQYLRGMYYTLKKDKEIKKQVHISNKPSHREKLKTPARQVHKIVHETEVSPPVPKLPVEKTVHEKELKTPAPPVRKTVYDKKPLRRATREDIIPEESAPTPTPIPLAGKFEKSREKQKTTLLGSIQDKKRQGSSLLGGKEEAKDSKKSLLEKIKTRK
ncbi:MAG: protein-glutamate O-methyltransferase CheR [Deltaproteobacteria bacterium]|nr:protein-glutamate O-methyltransferase CheR [Deltaproteobacteria bacterium]